MPFLPPNQQRQSTEGNTVLALIQKMAGTFCGLGHLALTMFLDEA